MILCWYFSITFSRSVHVDWTERKNCGQNNKQRCCNLMLHSSVWRDKDFQITHTNLTDYLQCSPFVQWWMKNLLKSTAVMRLLINCRTNSNCLPYRHLCTISSFTLGWSRSNQWDRVYLSKRLRHRNMAKKKKKKRGGREKQTDPQYI